MRSRLEPMKRVGADAASPSAPHPQRIRAAGTIAGGVVEGFNNKAKLTTNKAYGFRELKTLEIALYHQLGNPPEPEFTHRFR